MATTFHPFPRLPFELRAHIWASVAGHRMVHIHITPTHDISDRRKTYPRSDYSSPTPPPAVLHVCRESRWHAPYQKAFFTSSPHDCEEAHYIWVNFQEDLICLADYRVARLAPHEAEIQRLRFTVPNGDYGDVFYSHFFHYGEEDMRGFTTLRELQVAIQDYYLLWESTIGHCMYGSCRGENIKYLDLQTGLLLTGPQLQIAGRWVDQGGGRVVDVDNFDEEMELINENRSGLRLWELAEID